MTPLTNVRPVAAAGCLPITAGCAVLTVTIGGQGSGTLRSSDGNFHCYASAGSQEGTCAYGYKVGVPPAPKTVYFELIPDTGKNACDTATATCSTFELLPSVTFSANTTITTYEFTVDNPAHVRFDGSGTGSASIASTPGGISCPTLCIAWFTIGTHVSLLVTPDVGTVFVGWDDTTCKGQDATCDFPLLGDVTLRPHWELAAATPGPTKTPKPTSTPGHTLGPSAAPSPSPGESAPTEASTAPPSPSAGPTLEPGSTALPVTPAPSAGGTPAGSTSESSPLPLLLAGLVVAIAALVLVWRRHLGAGSS